MYNTSKLISKMSKMAETSSWPLCSNEDECPHCYREEEEEDYDGVESDWSSFCLDDEEEELVQSELTTKMSNMEETDSWPLCMDEYACVHCYREEEEQDNDSVESDWSSFCLDDEGEEELEDIPPPTIQDIPPPTIQDIPPPPIQHIPPPLVLQMIELGNGLWIEFDIWNNNQHNWIQTPESPDSGFTDTDTDTD